MSYVRCLRGLGSGHEYPADRPMNLDPIDNRPVEIVLDLQRLARAQPDLAWYHRARRDMWRFGALLPLDIEDATDAGHIVTLGEGCTPLREYADHPLARSLRIRLQVKDEGKAEAGYGSNPTQSFKDRGMAVTVSMARRFGIKKLVVPTQGNAGDSLLEYALAAGVEAAVIMPVDTPMPIQGRAAAAALRTQRVRLELIEAPSARQARACASATCRKATSALPPSRSRAGASRERRPSASSSPSPHPVRRAGASQTSSSIPPAAAPVYLACGRHSASCRLWASSARNVLG